MPISIDPANPKRRVAAEGKGERLSASRWRVRSEAGEARLVEWFPETGRTHQLRVHAAKLGAPILGDVMYGGSKRLVRDNGRVVTARRVMLHCWKLRLPRVDGDELALEEPPPAEFLKVWADLGGSPLDG
jgi:tRNA pseudouridine32 synthase/23S rRNA pseudouridine746 synthase